MTSMPKRKQIETQAEQSERFRRAVQVLVDAGELSPPEAENELDRIVREQSLRRPDDGDS